MPTVTQSRSGLNSPKVHYAFSQGGTNSETGWLDLDPWSQTTTSWRTGRNYVSEDEAYQDMTGTELRKNMFDEYARAYDTGHEFSSIRNTELQISKLVYLKSDPSPTGIVYQGPFVINTTVLHSGSPGPVPTSYLPSSSEIRMDGTKLWADAVPTGTEVSLASFLGELREGLPQLPGYSSYYNTGIRGSRKATPAEKMPANEYLNWKFGILPMKQDLQNLARGILDFHKRVEQFRRDSGRNVRRRRGLGEHRREVDLGSLTGVGKVYIPTLFNTDVLSSFYYQSLGTLKTIDIIDTNVWFAGAYTYYLSEAHDFLGKLERYEQLANHALGLEFDLDTAWELTPWSWLVDWFSDAGSFIHNLTALSNDNVVARYAYVMHHTKVTRAYTVTGMRPYTGVTGPTTISAFETMESKKRTRSTPYGFGFDMNALSGTQSAILGALGLTKAPGILH